MPAPSTFKKLEAYDLAKKLVVDCYELTHDLSQEEKTNLSRIIRQAAVTAFISVAQGIFLRKKKKKKKMVRSAQNALVVIDAAIEVLLEVDLVKEEQTRKISELSSSCYQLLNRLIGKE
jgi:four helix bundle protein